MGGVVDAIGDVVGGVADVAGDVVGGVARVPGEGIVARADEEVGADEPVGDG